jgi:tripartite-type tricarboxylate transporter receptor subunit TctC
MRPPYSIRPVWAIFAVLSATLAAGFERTSAAESYPSRPIRIVVPYSAGGPADIAARIIGRELSESLHQSVYIENKPGAGEIVANAQVAAAAKDGHTLLISTPVFPLSFLLRTKLPYQLGDFAPISQIVSQPYGILIPATLPATTIRTYVDYVKARPGKLNFAHPGAGSPVHLLSLRFQRLTGIDMIGIPYPGAAPSERAVISGEVQFLVDTPLTSLPLHRGGQARLLGFASGRRLDNAPDIPTLEEQGVPLLAESWYGVLTTAGTPRATIDLLNKAVIRAVASDEYRSRVIATGAVPRSSTPEEFADLISRTGEEYRSIVAELGIHLDSP